ncbi:DAK2 domain fusion protein YloV [Intrasporangium chromatireducens Q5-1]|uniref:DAK2 domain fusion protein YloV n=1 Tax=Intrasporangium chromatireducens Q5-1 TaxID=584657 RepID=W9GGZ8_9MICO|nr:DAK2 domain-containing protein [Intrasporangium chromatireducens]EWT05360.1 DAK2 domain fusion protein YloV [Intrasporangium chromatireducens Q5-1]
MPGAAPTPEEGLEVLDVNAVRRWAVLVRSAFAARRAEIDALNVFPVPDGDTGTNLFLTFDGAVDRTLTEPADTGAGDLLVVFAKNLLWSARGNSGVILSQLARGLAEACQGEAVIRAATLAKGLVAGDRRAWEAVTDPREGTILSVSRAASQGGLAEAASGLHAVARAALESGRTALERTPQQLEVLARAGVVDAGGAGLVLLLECLERLCAGDDGRLVLSLAKSGRRGLRPLGPAAMPVPLDTEPAAEEAAPEYEVMYLLGDATDAGADVLRQRLVELGDSVLVVGADGTWNVHAHVDDVGAAIEAGIEAGRPHQVRVARLAQDAPQPPRLPPGHPAPDGTGLIACAAGDGLAQLFREAGAAVLSTGPGKRTTTGELIAAIRERHEAGAHGVIILPNDGDTELAAAAAARAVADEGIEALVVRSHTPVQGVAAIAVFEPSASAGANVLAMQFAAAGTRHGAVTIADRSALTSGGRCEPGDVLGIVDEDIVIVGSDLTRVGAAVGARLLSSGGELLTVIVGDGATLDLGEAVAEAARHERREVESTVLRGGQQVYPLLLGVE